mmetsp:Transcript_50210/g.57996  ORF Transcript_50210/g.57996 Transcript_50210/m.57996 type:complete len:93 (+) Transcript_50210:30-308(+)
MKFHRERCDSSSSLARIKSMRFFVSSFVVTTTKISGQGRKTNVTTTHDHDHDHTVRVSHTHISENTVGQPTNNSHNFGRKGKYTCIRLVVVW